MSEPTSTKAPAASADASTPPATGAAPVDIRQPLPDNIDEHVEAEDNGEDNDRDSAYGSSIGSETATIRSAIYRGYYENGRKYQALKEEGYLTPADELQQESIALGHILYKVLDCQQENPLFRAPIGPNAQNILDVGCGDGSWAIDVADMFPNMMVHGVDLFPPSETVVPPNCFLEVDDASRPWQWRKKFDLIHLRLMLGAFSQQEWKRVYQEAYDNLEPGGWIEEVENDPSIYSDDGTMPADSLLAAAGDLCKKSADAYGKSVNIYNTMRSDIEEAGFINVQETTYKIPLGAWAKHPVYKDAGAINMDYHNSGLEGWVMFLFTKFGVPEPWSIEQVRVYLAMLSRELDSRPAWHIYQKSRRVWAQKPFDAPKKEKTAEVDSLADD